MMSEDSQKVTQLLTISSYVDSWQRNTSINSLPVLKYVAVYVQIWNLAFVLTVMPIMIIFIKYSFSVY